MRRISISSKFSSRRRSERKGQKTDIRHFGTPHVSELRNFVLFCSGDEAAHRAAQRIKGVQANKVDVAALERFSE